MEPLRTKSQTGNMLVFVGITTSVVALGSLMAITIGSTHFTYGRLVTSAQEVSLQSAVAMNTGDRIGEMNQMIARSRAGIFAQQLNLNRVRASYRHISQFAEMLHDDSIQGAQLVARERTKLQTAVLQDVKNAAEKSFLERRPQLVFQLPWLTLSQPTLRIHMGHSRSEYSNVADMRGFAELHALDSEDALKDGFYKAYRENHLPGSDSWLSFRLCNLAPPDDSAAVPARACLAQNQVDDDKDVVTACTIEIRQQLSSLLGTQTLTGTATAITTGGAPVSESAQQLANNTHERSNGYVQSQNIYESNEDLYVARRESLSRSRSGARARRTRN